MHNEIPSKLKEGRRWDDYLSYKKEHPEICTVQMDCVEGCANDSACILTLHFEDWHTQLGFIMESQTSANVVKTLDIIEETIGKEIFAKCFSVILTDNGHEFIKISEMETSIYGGQRTKIFFCEPNRSDQKGECERNHRLMRYIIPKGTSLEPFMQEHITLMMNHINSYRRISLMDNAPYDISMNVLPKDLFDLLGLERIPDTEVNITPALLGYKNPTLLEMISEPTDNDSSDREL